MQHLVDAFLDYLTVERGLSTNTRVAYREDLAEFTRFLERRTLTQVQSVQRQHITDFLLAQKRPKEVIELLKDWERSDVLLLRLALAGKAAWRRARWRRFARSPRRIRRPPPR